MAGLAGDGGDAGLELEDGKAVSMKRSVRDNMFRYIQQSDLAYRGEIVRVGDGALMAGDIAFGLWKGLQVGMGFSVMANAWSSQMADFCSKQESYALIRSICSILRDADWNSPRRYKLLLSPFYDQKL